MTGLIKTKERDTIVQALRAGVVPRLGLRHVQVGRAREVEEVVRDVNRLREGGSAVRFVIGEYGSGKTFFLNLARAIAIESKCVTTHADLAPDRRIHATGGQARGLYAELIRNMSTRTKPDGGALASVVERFIGDARKGAESDRRKVADEIATRLAPLQDLIAGHDFALVIQRYYEAFEDGDEAKKAAALRWLRGEYALKTEAREALGVRSIITDQQIYDYLKVMGRFARLAGYDGFLVVLDEMVNLFKLVNSQARNANYEQILRIVNDVLQGQVGNFGVYFGGTPEFLLDTRRGLYSYEALRSRLAENSFARDGLVDVAGPVVRLPSLTPEELYVLLNKLRHVHAGGVAANHLVPDDALTAFMEHCSKRVGDAYFRTPRNTIKAFLDLLSILEQNPSASWDRLLASMPIDEDRPPPIADIVDEPGTSVTLPGKQPSKSTGDDDLATFKL
jgi:hypothetical protein